MQDRILTDIEYNTATILMLLLLSCATNPKEAVPQNQNTAFPGTILPGTMKIAPCWQAPTPGCPCRWAATAHEAFVLPGNVWLYETTSNTVKHYTLPTISVYSATSHLLLDELIMD